MLYHFHFLDPDDEYHLKLKNQLSNYEKQIQDAINLFRDHLDFHPLILHQSFQKCIEDLEEIYFHSKVNIIT